MSTSDPSKDSEQTRIPLEQPTANLSQHHALNVPQHHYKTRYKKQLQQHRPPNHLLARMLKGVRFSIRSGLMLLNQNKIPGLKVVPSSVLEEIKIHGPLTDTQLDKVRQRQSLFLNKRRVSKQRKQLFTRIKVLIRLALCIAIIASWWMLWGLPMWFVAPNNITLQHFNTKQQQQDFVDDQAVSLVIKPFLKTPLYWINPQDVSSKVKTTVRPMQPIKQAIVRRRLFPASLDITIIEKPIWATRIPLSDHYSNSLTLAQQALKTTLAPNPNANHAKHAELKRPKNPIPLITLRHPNGDKTAFYTDQLTDQQRLFIKTHPIVFTGPKNLSTVQLSLLEKSLTQLQIYQPLFDQTNEQLISIDARDTNNVMAYFTHFKVRFGRINTQLPKRVARLPKVLPTIPPYLSKLDWIELGWNNQLTLKLKTVDQVNTLPPQQ